MGDLDISEGSKLNHSRWVEKNRLRRGKSSTVSSPKKSKVSLAENSKQTSTNPTSRKGEHSSLQFTDTSTDISDTEFRISVLLDITNDDDDDSEPPTIILQVKYPEDYPEEPPTLDLLPPPNAPTHTYFSVASDKDSLLDGLKETIEENMGMAMIFTIYSTLKDNAEQLVAERQAAARAVHEQKLLAAEQEENKKFHGTPVTPETFTSWRRDFRKEMEEVRVREEEVDEAAEKKKNRGKDTVVQLTGKQLWERGLAGKIEEDEDEDDALPAEVEKLKVEA